MGPLCYQNQWFPKLVEYPGPPTASQIYGIRGSTDDTNIGLNLQNKPTKFSSHPNTPRLGSRSIQGLRRQTDQLRAEETVRRAQPRKHESL